MKNRTIAIIAVLLALVLTAAFVIKTDDQTDLLILSPIIHPARLLSSPADWEKWNPVLRKYCLENSKACAIANNLAQNSFTILYPQGSFTVAYRAINFDITQTTGNHSTTYNYTLASSLHDDSTRLFITEKRSLFSSILHLSENSVALNQADSLKHFIETPSSFYGFPIEITPVIDSDVVTIHKIIATANRTAELKSMYGSINKFISANGLTITQPCIARYEHTVEDSIDVVAAIPVEKIVPQSGTNNNISCMKMPVHGRMLVGYFKGRYEGRAKLYQAMDRYASDKRLQKIAASYEKYLTNTVPENDSAEVELKIYYPVL